MSKSPSSPSSFPATPPPEAWAPLVRITRVAARPLDRFLGIQASSGLLLLLAAVIALIWANSPWSASYVALWQTPIGIRFGEFAFERPLEWVVNDGLMVIFFFVVGMEIRREVHDGELADWRRAALPAAAAIGGMLVPAALYLVVAGAPATRSGWGVPMATDIAFAVGVLALLGDRVPAAMRVVLLALAVIDDLGAIVVIAAFYSSGIAVSGLAIAASGFAGVFGLRAMGVRSKLAYVLPGIVVWAGIYAAGIHPTIAGVLLGIATPVRAWFGADGFVEGMKTELDRLSTGFEVAPDRSELARSLVRVDQARREAVSPSESLIERLHPWVAYGIMPIFALANAGVSVGGGGVDPSDMPVLLGVVLGLVVGKPIGVFLSTWLVVRTRLGVLPAGMTPVHVGILGMVAGVGFTMSLFIAGLAFPDANHLETAKLGVLLASGAAAVLALVLGRLSLPRAYAERAEFASSHAADTSTNHPIA